MTSHRDGDETGDVSLIGKKKKHDAWPSFFGGNWSSFLALVNPFLALVNPFLALVNPFEALVNPFEALVNSWSLRFWLLVVDPRFYTKS